MRNPVLVLMTCLVNVKNIKSSLFFFLMRNESETLSFDFLLLNIDSAHLG